ncbi:MAG: aminotransferase class V-fold PLP-dependent enzyme, partial [Bdellovibrionota bacterium]
IGAQHEIRCLSPRGKTLHVYTPRLREEAATLRFSTPRHGRLHEEIDLKLSEGPLAWHALAETLRQIEKNSLSTHSPFFMNQLFSGVLAETIAAEEVITRSKTTMATFEASPALSAVEIEVVEALGKLIGWKESEGICVPGGSAANFMALHCARQHAFPEMKATGLDGRRLKVFISAEAHYSFKKACVALGIGRDNLVPIAVDAQGRMQVALLDEALAECRKRGDTPLMVCATAGTTVLGSFDPIREISTVCRRHGIWLHVDGAWGGPALFSKTARTLVDGIESADSMTFDAHKLFGAGLTCSFFLTRHQRLLLEANDVSGADYLFHSDETQDRGRLSWQCGRRADALSFWTIWKSHGSEGLGAFVDRLFETRRELLDWLSDQPRLQLVSKPEFLNVCVRVIPPQTQASQAREWSRHVRESLKEENLAFVNFSTNADGTFLRLILANPFLNFTHLRQILEAALSVKA